MAAINYHKYDEEFKKSLVSTPPLKSPTVKSSLPNK